MKTKRKTKENKLSLFGKICYTCIMRAEKKGRKIMDGDLFSLGEEEEKALKAQEKEDKRILEEKGFSLSDGGDLQGFGEFLSDDVNEDLW